MIKLLDKFKKEKEKTLREFQGIKIVDIPDEYNNKVEVTLRITRQEEVKDFRVKIEGVNKLTNEIIVLHPMEGTDKFIVYDEDKLEMMLQDDKGMKYWECKKIKDLLISKLELLRIKQVDDVKKVNRRGAYRINIDKEINYVRETGNGDGRLIDISFTGVQLETAEEFYIGECININLEGVGNIILEIVRIIESEGNKKVYGAKYIDKDSRSLEKYVCDIQINKIKKNKLS